MQGTLLLWSYSSACRNYRKVVSKLTMSKTYKYLYSKMLDKEIILKAYKKLRKGKTKRNEIKYIDAHLEEEIENMRLMILNTKPEGYHVENPELTFVAPIHKERLIYEHGKWRKIYQPNIKEQWLHHIIVQVLAPIILKSAYPYACGSFPKRGAHYGKKHLERQIFNSVKGIKYFLKIDIRHFYASIRKDILFDYLNGVIQDDLFLHILSLCLVHFKIGLPLGYYIAQWLANYFLEPLDKFIKSLGYKIQYRYMDDILLMGDNKRKLHRDLIEIMKFIGRRFRLKLKGNWQIARFDYTKRDGHKCGRPIDFMGFKFYRFKTIMRKSIMIASTRLAKRLHKEDCKYSKHIHAMLSYLGWYKATDTYNCFQKYIKPYVSIRNLKRIISNVQRKENLNDTMGRREMHVATA